MSHCIIRTSSVSPVFTKQPQIQRMELSRLERKPSSCTVGGRDVRISQHVPLVTSQTTVQLLEESTSLLGTHRIFREDIETVSSRIRAASLLPIGSGHEGHPPSRGSPCLNVQRVLNTPSRDLTPHFRSRLSVCDGMNSTTCRSMKRMLIVASCNPYSCLRACAQL